ncbi:sugar transporter [Amylibacter sp. SFDW26]|uniref:polysaccharide biosynthesis/export family protein n=1 Tax=Amylibacter sp. SFDW26 TaxID=2652722 RepID=UPI0012624585|nr:polysaccharide biosynthesis/export family protein [Amylibacter sp. SFDW26]KAB7609836.1 sugar transporter [Amylibacter sp. SFDW26]
MKKNAFKSIVLTIPATLTACGSIYTSPKVSKTNKLVEIIEVTPYSVEFANETSYAPQRLPKSFKSIQSARANLPSPIETLPTLPRTVQTSIPPKTKTGPYKIGVSDVLLLATPVPTTQEALTGLIAAQNRRQGYTVQDDGAIAVPEVGRVSVAGLTLSEAENAVFRALVNRQIDPKFSLEIAEFNSQKVSIAGAVNDPLLTPIKLKQLTLQDAIQTAGGISTPDLEFAVARINRDGKTYQIPLQELRKKSSLQKIALQNGDSIFIDEDYRIDRARAYTAEQLALTQARTTARKQALDETEAVRASFLQQLELGAIKSDYVFLTGEVREQGRFRLPFENKASLADALYSSRGIQNQNGDPGQIYVLRYKNIPDDKPITAYHVNGKDASNLLMTTRLLLRPNDIIFVSEQKVTAWNRVISNLLPSTTIIDRAIND